MNKQEKFWHSDYADEYIKRNSHFDEEIGATAWQKMLVSTSGINSILELGSNIGRNIGMLNKVLPEAKKSIIELSPIPYQIVKNKYDLEYAVNSSILNSDLEAVQFDMVFTSGVLIHVEPSDLLKTMQKMFDYSSKYILICEMFSRVPRTVNYKKSNDLLFTRDFGRYFLENFPCSVVDYGFLWGHYFDPAGFDDANYWIFEK